MPALPAPFLERPTLPPCGISNIRTKLVMYSYSCQACTRHQSSTAMLQCCVCCRYGLGGWCIPTFRRDWFVSQAAAADSAHMPQTQTMSFSLTRMLLLRHRYLELQVSVSFRRAPSHGRPSQPTPPCPRARQRWPTSAAFLLAGHPGMLAGNPGMSGSPWNVWVVGVMAYSSLRSRACASDTAPPFHNILALGLRKLGRPTQCPHCPPTPTLFCRDGIVRLRERHTLQTANM